MPRIHHPRGTTMVAVTLWFCLMSRLSAFSTQSNLFISRAHRTTRTPFPSSLYSATEERVAVSEAFLKDARPRRSRLRNYLWRHSSFPRKIIRIYADYARQLWYETSTDARKHIASDKAAAAIRAVEHLIKDEEYVEFNPETTAARQNLLESCEAMLVEMRKTQAAAKERKNKNRGTAVAVTSEAPLVKEKKRRSILFGATMGFAVACWVFSGNWIFTGVFTLMTVLGQLEYYRMVMNTGVYPARKISVVGACSMFLTALFAPSLHQICLPFFGMWAMMWFVTMRRSTTSIPEIATTFTGMFYLGYVPSFWVRIRLFGMAQEPTRLAPLAAPLLSFLGKTAESLPAFIPSAVHLPITEGAIFIFWTWLSLAFSDVAAYFVGRKYGKTKLGALFPAAGATSPNKSVEGLAGACVVSAMLSMIGAWVQKWPYWVVTGAIHGASLAFLGLIGDLTASMLKRDAGLKDFGDLIPEHGGIMDRVDSFVWTAPYSWLVCAYAIPALKNIARARTILPV